AIIFALLVKNFLISQLCHFGLASTGFASHIIR
ncbi:hypothetical protein ACUXHT_002679, partial [Staphylococcus cohnii]